MGDDVPYDLPTPNGPLVEVPVHWLLDDVPFFAFVPGAPFVHISDTSTAIDEWSREFRAPREEAGCFVLTMHPWVSGRPGRRSGVRDLIREMQIGGSVWFATALEVAQRFAFQRTESIPGMETIDE